MSPYVPCTDLIISIEGEPDETWILDFFTRLDGSELGSLTLINRTHDQRENVISI